VIAVDSDYVLRGIVCLIWNRQKAFDGVANPDLWLLVDRLIAARTAGGRAAVRFVHVLGHSSIHGNEIADRLANDATALPAVTKKALEKQFRAIELGELANSLLMVEKS